MSLEYERLISLLEFTQQSAKLKSSPIATIGSGLKGRIFGGCVLVDGALCAMCKMASW